MTPERIKLFLRCFYEAYILDCYQGFEIEDDTENWSKKMDQYNISGYLIENLDIYIENCDFLKEYSIIYNPVLFDSKKETNPELFNELQISLIENIQLFLHTILEAVINSQILKTSKVKGLRLYIAAIDNKKIYLLNLVEKAEEQMKKLHVHPPAMG